VITWTNALAILRALISETATAVPDVEIMAATNAALLAVYGDLLVVSTPATVVMTTGTYIYDVPANFLYIQDIWDASGNPLPSYSWEVRAGGGATSPKIIFGVGFTPVTGQDVTVAGWQAKTVKPTGAVPSGFTATIAAGTDELLIGPGWLAEASLTALHAAEGGTASDLADWHKGQSSAALQELRKRLLPTIPPVYRPPATARLVPGRGE